MTRYLLLLAACGRINIDELADASRGACDAGHDEDFDSIDDNCDVCPHVADPQQLDGDGDRVGDACDREPAIARQSIIYFDPFTSLAGWTAVDGFESVTGSALTLLGKGRLSRVSRPYSPAHDDLIAQVNTGAGDTTTHSVAIVRAAPGGFFCELYDTGIDTVCEVRFTYTLDDVNYNTPGRYIASTKLADISRTLMYTIVPGMLNECHVLEEPGGGAGTALSLPETSSQVQLLAQNIDVRVHYFIHIRTFD